MVNRNIWQSSEAREIAGIIAALPGLYCGPASVGWIAAIWNTRQGRSYDFKKRLSDKKIFPDGPRAFHLHLPGFQMDLNDLLKRETNHELGLGLATYFGHQTISNVLSENSLPVIIRIPGSTLKDGLHYVTAYSTERRDHSHQSEVRFAWQDNGLYSAADRIGPGLSHSPWRKVEGRLFPWGAKKVIVR